MPGYDRTGERGQGAGSGRGRGYGAGGTAPGSGKGRGNRGGQCRGLGFGVGRGECRIGSEEGLTPDAEKILLKSQKEALANRLQTVEERLAELEAEKPAE